MDSLGRRSPNVGQGIPPNAIKFSGKQGFQELALYLRESLHLISGDLTGYITHHQFVFAFGRVRLQCARIVPPLNDELESGLLS
jgi:hypothetical protein